MIFHRNFSFYKCVNVEDSIELEPSDQPTGTAAALAYVHLENDALHLSDLGIDIYDPLLTQQVKDVELLDIQTRLPHKWWYDFVEHKRLQRAIIKEL
jgi:hypothetical protein